MTKIVRTSSALRAIADLLDEVDLPDGAVVSITVYTAIDAAGIQGDAAAVAVIADHLGVRLPDPQLNERDGNYYAASDTALDGQRLRLCAVGRCMDAVHAEATA